MLVWQAYFGLVNLEYFSNLETMQLAQKEKKKGFFNFPHDEKPREIINQVESFPGKEGFS